MSVREELRLPKRECSKAEVLTLFQKADPDTKKVVLKLLELGESSPGFMAAFAEATPPGEEHPPVDVAKALVDEWSRKECL